MELISATPLFEPRKALLEGKRLTGYNSCSSEIVRHIYDLGNELRTGIEIELGWR